MYDGFVAAQLDAKYLFFHGRLPACLIPTQCAFEALWALHPTDFHEIMMHGRLVKTPRWQRAYGKDYHYTNRTNRALLIPAELKPLLSWANQQIDPRLNGLLLNWYDGTLGHYIGRHRDSTANMVSGAPIITISLGETRVFRLRPWKRQGMIDFAAEHGTVFIMPYETNLAWTHEVPHSARRRGRRISVTLRAFG
jgi:alkylated DNA repair dioxygenase AlkB